MIDLSQHPNSARIMDILRERNALWRTDILSVDQFTPEVLDQVFRLSDAMRDIVEENGGMELLKNRVMAAVFYEPSPRTSASFTGAMGRLGGSWIPIRQGVRFSSVSKGESLGDTLRTLEQYADAIVLRHPEKGSVQTGAGATACPVINAGDGIGEHPTQCLLDLYTIYKEKGRLDGLTVTMVGDLLYGRTVHSLTRVLKDYDIRFRFVSPENLRLPMGQMQQLRDRGKDVREMSDVADAMEVTDVLYVTRVQRERFPDATQYEAVRDSYKITPEGLKAAKNDMAILHPLPRVNEIPETVDADPRAAYFRQARNGLYTRMALLAMVLCK